MPADAALAVDADDVRGVYVCRGMGPRQTAARGTRVGVAMARQDVAHERRPACA